MYENALTFICPPEYLRPAQIFSLASVSVLAVLFFFLNRFSKRNYFAIWGTAWLFHALWLTLRLIDSGPADGGWMQSCKQWSIGTSGIFLFWGSLVFMRIPARSMLFGLFMTFVLIWSWTASIYLDSLFFARLPLFILTGLASLFAAAGFFRVRLRQRFLGASMLGISFSFWGVFLCSFPFLQESPELVSASFSLSAVLQLFIAVSMIVLMLEEVQMTSIRMLKKIAQVKSRKRELELKAFAVEQEYRTLLEQPRLDGDLHQAYHELRRTNHVAAQQERLRALGQMASGIGHDINNALSPVVAYADLVIQTEKLSDKSRGYLECIKTAGEDIARIVANIREFYRKRENKEPLQPVDLNRISQQVIDMTRPRWRDIPQSKGVSVEVETSLAEDLPVIFSNGSELREAVTNLVLNAVDALPQGGTITLSTSLVPSSGYKTIPHVVLEVRDTGMGMDENTRKRCLEPFFSTKSQSGGTGLGLAMVFGVVERHRGTIEIKSAVGSGTVMRLIFPSYKPGETDVVQEEQSSLRPPHSLRILYIDDEPALRDLIQEILSIGGHHIKVADGGKAGIEAFRAARIESEPFDVIITDLGMPNIDGKQVAQTIKRESPITPVIMLTGWGSMMEADGNTPTHVDLVLSKPPKLNVLMEALEDLTSGERAMVHTA